MMKVYATLDADGWVMDMFVPDVAPPGAVQISDELYRAARSESNFGIWREVKGALERRPSEKPAAPTYRQLRAAEYPPAADYLDGVVKGDQAQVQAYIDACLAVKKKYPKP